MSRLKRFALLSLPILLIFSPVFSQGTLHGVLLSWTALAPIGTTLSNGNTLTGYNVYQCSGSACTPATKIDSSIDATNGYMVLYNTLSLGTSYSYCVTSVDNAGNESNCSTNATVTTPAAWQVNPPVPAGLQAVIK